MEFNCEIELGHNVSCLEMLSYSMKTWPLTIGQYVENTVAVLSEMAREISLGPIVATLSQIIFPFSILCVKLSGNPPSLSACTYAEAGVNSSHYAIDDPSCCDAQIT